MKKIASFILLGLMLIAAIITTGCTGPSQSALSNSQIVQPELTPAPCPISNYGNGTLYFACIDQMFVTTLSDYIGRNNVTVTGIVPVPNVETYNSLKGYIVVVK